MKQTVLRLERGTYDGRLVPKTDGGLDSEGGTLEMMVAKSHN